MRRFPFVDVVSGEHCMLVVEAEGAPGVEHPGCPSLADVSAELDAFYCHVCTYSGRISGAWCAGRVREARR